MLKLADKQPLGGGGEMRSKHKAQVIKANPAESTQFTRLKDIFFRGTLPYSDGRAGLAGLVEERRPLAEPSEPLAGGTIQGSSCFFSSCRLAVLKSTKTLTYGQSKEAEIRRWLTLISLFGVFFSLQGLERTTLLHLAGFYCLAIILW